MRVLEKVARMPRGRQAFHGAKSSCPSQQFSHRSLAIAIELYPLYSAVGGRQPHSAAGLPHIGDRGDVIAQHGIVAGQEARDHPFTVFEMAVLLAGDADRKSTRLNSSHRCIS